MSDDPTTLLQFLLSWVPLWLLTLPWAVGAYLVAPKMGRRRWIWVPAFCIPILNFLLIPIFILLIAGAILDRLNVPNNEVR